jgi:hypothetical protein
MIQGRAQFRACRSTVTLRSRESELLVTEKCAICSALLTSKLELYLTLYKNRYTLKDTWTCLVVAWSNKSVHPVHPHVTNFRFLYNWFRI